MPFTSIARHISWSTLPLLVFTAGVCGCLVAQPANAKSKKKPDLTVPTVAGSPSRANLGSSFRLTVTVRNRGKGKAKASKVQALLSANGSKQRALRLAEAAVPKLKKRKNATVTLSGKLPAVLASTGRVLLVCADSAGKLKEKSETNNCKTSNLDVVASGAPASAAQAPATSTPAGPTGPTDPEPPECVPTSSTDLPDPAFVDADCDGIDGQIDDSVFVSTTGANNASCGTMVAPCQTIDFAIVRAGVLGEHNVLVSGGTFQKFRAAAGVDVYGAFGSNFQRDPVLATGSRTVTVQGSFDAGEGHTYAAIVENQSGVTLTDLNFTGQNGSTGSSSYAIVLKTSTVTINRGTIVAGNGGVGQVGGDGGNASASQAAGGTDGGHADQPNDACNDDDHGGPGSAGTGVTGASTNPNGGAGGAGGAKDTDCVFDIPPVFNFTAQPGEIGHHASVTFGTFGTRGSLGTGGTGCSQPGDGQPGRVIDGPAGASVGGAGKLSSDMWVGNTGTAGTLGQNGGGGGGGGGSGGCDQDAEPLDTYGAGGGGGGAGGARAPSAGQGGTPGGGSFGIFANSSTLTVITTSITRGSGGNGGAGGEGGIGQPGGGHGDGGAASNDSKAGGDGGDGGRGGHSGGGGGGAGGVSYGIFRNGGSLTNSATFSGGTAGVGGTGGASFGNDGSNGPTGASGNTGTCAAPGGC